MGRLVGAQNTANGKTLLDPVCCSRVACVTICYQPFTSAQDPACGQSPNGLAGVSIEMTGLAHSHAKGGYRDVPMGNTGE